MTPQTLTNIVCLVLFTYLTIGWHSYTSIIVYTHIAVACIMHTLCVFWLTGTWPQQDWWLHSVIGLPHISDPICSSVDHCTSTQLGDEGGTDQYYTVCVLYCEHVDSNASHIGRI